MVLMSNKRKLLESREPCLPKADVADDTISADNLSLMSNKRKLLESREPCLPKSDLTDDTISADNLSLLRRSKINGSYKQKEEYTLGDCMTVLKSMNLSGRQFELVKAKLVEHLYWRIFFLVITPENRLDWATRIG
ncbi:hypothetical protein LguiA_016862 [Lonicera macranthoides]